MFFAKDELVELDDKKEYFILNTTILDNNVFYQIQEVQDNNVVGKKSIMLAVNEEGNLFIEDVADKKLITELNEIWAS